MSARLKRLVVVLGIATLWWSCVDRPSLADPARADAEQARRDALARARVFRDVPRPDRLRVAETPAATQTCRFVPVPTSGTTPKFTCALADGTRVKVKYGNSPEVPAEVAATRLLEALGFGADRVTLAARVRCYGCPASPFYLRRIADWARVGDLVRDAPDYAGYRDFTWTAVEQKIDGESIDGDTEGWGFYELDRIDPTRGGATRAEVDALRLMAIVLVHWDNKTANQRLVCLAARTDGSCARSLVMLQDLGATFGPRKVDLDDWRGTPVWADPTGCRVSMASLPHAGGTFPDDVHISEGGRRLLAERLAALSRGDVASLFEYARFPGGGDRWADAFAGKVEQIATRTCGTGWKAAG